MNQRGKISVLLFFFSICGTAALVNHYLQHAQPPVKPAERARPAPRASDGYSLSPSTWWNSR